MLIGTCGRWAKRLEALLAQSSIGQMGYILLGLGLGLAFLPHNPVYWRGGARRLPLPCGESRLLQVAALLQQRLHAVPHRHTGSEPAGGLVKVMPLTAACAIVGALSIAGAPPFNGFVSKWLLYQSAILGETATPLYVFYGVVAIFMGTVTLAYFMKYLGSAYLGTLPERLCHSERSEESRSETRGLATTHNQGGILRSARNDNLHSGAACPQVDGDRGDYSWPPACLLLGILPACGGVGCCFECCSPHFRHANAALGQRALGALPWRGLALDGRRAEADAAAPAIILAALSLGSPLPIPFIAACRSRAARRHLELRRTGARTRPCAIGPELLSSHFESDQPRVPEITWPRLPRPTAYARARSRSLALFSYCVRLFVRQSAASAESTTACRSSICCGRWSGLVLSIMPRLLVDGWEVSHDFREPIDRHRRTLSRAHCCPARCPHPARLFLTVNRQSMRRWPITCSIVHGPAHP